MEFTSWWKLRASARAQSVRLAELERLKAMGAKLANCRLNTAFWDTVIVFDAEAEEVERGISSWDSVWGRPAKSIFASEVAKRQRSRSGREEQKLAPVFAGPSLDEDYLKKQEEQ